MKNFISFPGAKIPLTPNFKFPVTPRRPMTANYLYYCPLHCVKTVKTN